MATTPEFRPSRPVAPFRQKLAAFWRWWKGEIARLVPERFSMLRGGGSAPMIALDGDDVVLASPPAGGGEARAVLAALDDARRKAAVRALLERAGETRGRARLALGHGEALMRKVTMPAATEENLRQVLAFEMDRLTPFKADEVYFDYRVLSRDAATGQILVQLAVARREVVDARAQKLRALGANVQGVAVRDEAGHGAALDLMPREQRGETGSSTERMVQYGLIGACVLLLLAALVFPVYQKRETFMALDPVVNKARQEAEAADAIGRALERQVADYNFLLTRKHANAPALAFVEDISRLLPDNTWVTSLEIKPVGKVREVQVIGETVSSSKLIEILESSTLIQNAAPRGTVTRGSQPGSERFMIVAEARARPLPEARPVMEVATVMQPAPVPVPAPPPVASANPPPPTAVVTPVPSATAPAAPPASQAQTPSQAPPVSQAQTPSQPQPPAQAQTPSQPQPPAQAPPQSHVPTPVNPSGRVPTPARRPTMTPSQK
jgi:general secretion pathway protein L